MSLYGALYSGVSGLTAQSSSMGAISDNITNVSTVGYKNTNVNFQTLVTAQTSSTFYSAGGVQSSPRQAVDVQGLLQASSSQTDIAISGGGFFVVNAENQPTVSDPYFYTRAGSFKQDAEGYLRNASGYYLQAWPTDASGNIIPADDTLSQTNLNVISTDYLETVNLSRVAGSAAATSQIQIGANLPAETAAGDNHKTDVQFFDSLGDARSISFSYTKTDQNAWDLDIAPPQGTSVVTTYDSSGNVYDSRGQLEFTARPTDGSTITINGVTYEFDSDATSNPANTAVDISGSTSISGDVTALVNAVKNHVTDKTFADYTTSTGTATNNRIKVNADNSNIIDFQDDGTGDFNINPASLLDSNGDAATSQTSTFTVKQQDTTYAQSTNLKFSGLPGDGETMVINGITYTFAAAEVTSDGDTSIRIDTLANMLSDLQGSIEANDPNYPAGTVKIRDLLAAPAGNDTLTLDALTGTSYSVNATGVTSTTVQDTYTNTLSGGAGTTVTVSQTAAINFDSDGLPSDINVAEVEVIGFTNGATNMDNTASNRMDVDFGTIGLADGMTQFGPEYTPTFIQQNGSRFGTFSGVSISPEGQVVALFDNGDTRPIFQIPVATFTNPNGLGSRSGNVWNASEASGDYTLRTAGNGPAGVVTQASLESSTVDIGEEFTNMIVVQRAYSASTKIISTADQMLEELMRTKR